MIEGGKTKTVTEGNKYLQVLVYFCCHTAGLKKNLNKKQNIEESVCFITGAAFTMQPVRQGSTSNEVFCKIANVFRISKFVYTFGI